MRVVMVPKPVGAPTNCGTANAPMLSTKTSTAPVAIAGASRGSVMVRSTVAGPAPEARAARSVVGSARVARPTALIKYTKGTTLTATITETPTGPWIDVQAKPNRSLVRPARAYARSQLYPRTKSGTRRGSTTAARQNARPGSCGSRSARAIATPTGTARRVAAAESSNECTTAEPNAGLPTTSASPERPSTQLVLINTASGITTSTAADASAIDRAAPTHALPDRTPSCRRSWRSPQAAQPSGSSERSSPDTRSARRSASPAR